MAVGCCLLEDWKLDSEVPLGELATLLRSDIVVGEVSAMGDEGLWPFHPKNEDILFEAVRFCRPGVRGPLLAAF